MPKTKKDELISQAEAARIVGLSRAAISYLVTTGQLRSQEVLGRKAVYRSDVEAYKPRATKSASKKGKK